jgi:putative transposase
VDSPMASAMFGSVPLHAWPIGRPSDWCGLVNVNERQEQIDAVRRSVVKGQPYGRKSWAQQMVPRWNLGATLRDRGRPKKVLLNNGS